MADTFEPKIIGIKQVIHDLKSGYTRWKKHDLGFGSIEEKYQLTFTEMKQLFADSRLKRIKTFIPTLLIVDDIEDTASYEKFKNINTKEVQEPDVITNKTEEEIEEAEEQTTKITKNSSTENSEVITDLEKIETVVEVQESTQTKPRKKSKVSEQQVLEAFI